jgi:hypothetical protein
MSTEMNTEHGKKLDTCLKQSTFALACFFLICVILMLVCEQRIRYPLNEKKNCCRDIKNQVELQ